MSRSRTDLMMDRLQDLQGGTPGVEASAIVSADGLVIASSLQEGMEEDLIAAMSAAMLSLGDRIASELQRGVLDQVYVKGEHGYILLTAIGEEAVLTILAGPTARLGMVFLEMRRAVLGLEQLI